MHCVFGQRACAPLGWPRGVAFVLFAGPYTVNSIFCAPQLLCTSYAYELVLLLHTKVVSAISLGHDAEQQFAYKSHLATQFVRSCVLYRFH